MMAKNNPLTTPMFVVKEPLVLASASPRRQDFLTDLGLDFRVYPADVDESVLAQEGALEFVERISLAKAVRVAEKHRESWVLAADTAVVVDGKILGKPAGQAEAVEMLLSLVGRTHQVWTGFCLYSTAKKVKIVRSVKTDVVFGMFSEEILTAYAATGDSLDKAGAYGIQSKGGFLVQEISGSYSNVVGLPMTEVLAELLNHNVITAVTIQQHSR